MQALFVHGMGRSPLSGWPVLLRLRRAGLKTKSFAYATSCEDFQSIRQRLIVKLRKIATDGDYIVIGHSLGGVLLRAAIATLPPGTRLPQRVFLLGSPQQASRLARKLRHNPIYRLFTGDCGQLLGSAERMAGIGAPPVPTTGIAGTRGLSWKNGPFQGEPNDGIVSLAEVSADWIADPLQIPTPHTALPASRHVADIILQRLQLKQA